MLQRSRGLLGSDEGATSSSRCSAGWPAFWITVLSGTSAAVINALVLPSIATSYFYGDGDPCIGAGHSSKACEAALAESARIGSSFTFAGAVCTFFSSPFIALLCDRFGRKPLIVAVEAFVLLQAVCLLLVNLFGFSLYVYYALGLVVGSLSATVVFTLWIADRTDASQRVAFLATLGAAMDLEQIVAPLASLFASIRHCLMLSTALCAVALLTTILGIQESKTAQQHRALCENLKLVRLFQASKVIATKKYRALSLLMLVSNTVHAGCAGIFLYYVKIRFGATVKDVAPIIFLNGIGAIIVQVGLVKHLSKWLGLKGVILLGYAFGAFNCAVLSIVPAFKWLYILVFTTGLGVIFTPAIQAVYLNAASSTEMAQVQGAMNSIFTLGGGLGPVLFSFLMTAFEAPHYGLTRSIYWVPYVLTIVVNAICAIMVLMVQFPDASESASERHSANGQVECSDCY